MVKIDFKQGFFAFSLFLVIILSNSICTEELLYSYDFTTDTLNEGWTNSQSIVEIFSKAGCQFKTHSFINDEGCFRITDDYATPRNSLLIFDFYDTAYSRDVLNLDTQTNRSGYIIFSFDFQARDILFQNIAAIDYSFYIVYDNATILELNCFDEYYEDYNFSTNVWYNNFRCYAQDSDNFDLGSFEFLTIFNSTLLESEDGLWLTDINVYYSDTEPSVFVTLSGLAALSDTLDLIIQILPLVMLAKINKGIRG